MKKTLLLILMLLTTGFIKAQTEYSNLTEIVTNLNSPNDLNILDDILYVATETQILSYNITTENPSANVIFTAPSATETTEEYITFFNINNGFIYVGHEKVNFVDDVFVASKITKIELGNLANTTLLETENNYVSAATFNGSLLYRITEDEINDLSILSVRDTAIPASSYSNITSFNGVVTSIDIFKNLILISTRNGGVNFVDITANTPSYLPLNLGETINGNTGIQVINDGLFIAANNKIYEGYLYDKNVNIDIYALIENTTYKDGVNNKNFNDVFIYKGVAYMTIADSGLIVKTEEISSDSNCENSGSTLNNFVNNLEGPRQLTKHNNDLYLIEQIKGISKIDINTKAKTEIYTALKTGNNYEILQRFIILNNNLYFTSRTINVSTFDFISSDIKKINLSSTPFTATTILSSSLESETIQALEINGTDILFSKIDDTNDDPIVTIHTLNTTNNTVTDTGLSFNYYIEEFAITGDDIYYTNDDDNQILKGDLNNLTNTPSVFLNANNQYIQHYTINDGILYLSINQEIKKVNLNSINPNASIEKIAVNGSVFEQSTYNTTYCSSFNGLTVDTNTAYASISNKIVSFNNETLSNSYIDNLSNNIFKIENDYILFNKTNSPLKGNIYKITGQKIIDFDSEISNKISIKNLTNGIYILTTKKGLSYKFLVD
ncbi:hypothetical protein FHR24_000297 [Wenyingzhuangia heitensis]|uniref:Por secretion system C-terminal sorting domain-containing protein n=1 Tax=Wenyingzhuangia heitensis TaxID=1487859 RepID=A0ABX0U4R8_9FLAO|nr:hypothetical protein [Wenyingzhuangia heitensis]NIJ43858.1 hypothetical protein [Wenyingzhuangia heitensis]